MSAQLQAKGLSPRAKGLSPRGSVQNREVPRSITVNKQEYLQQLVRAKVETVLQAQMLEYVASCTKPPKMTDVSKALKVPVSTCSRLLFGLVTHNLIEVVSGFRPGGQIDRRKHCYVVTKHCRRIFR